MKYGFAFRKARRTALQALVVLLFLLAALICGCGGDEETPQAPEIQADPQPDLSLSVSCVDGAPEVRVENSGGAMQEEGVCSVLYEDGTSDSLVLLLGADENLVCLLSNMHGGVTVQIEETALAGSQEDCLAPAFREMLETFGSGQDLAALIPAPLHEQLVAFCTYSFYLENIAYDPPAVSVTPVDGDLALQIIYANFSGDIRAESSDILCPPYAGSLTIGSIVYSARVVFFEGSPVLSEPDVSINDLDLQIDGVMGFLIGWVFDFFEGDFAAGFEMEFATGFESVLGPALEAILVEEKSCE